MLDFRGVVAVALWISGSLQHRCPNDPQSPLLSVPRISTGTKCLSSRPVARMSFSKSLSWALGTQAPTRRSLSGLTVFTAPLKMMLPSLATRLQVQECEIHINQRLPKDRGRCAHSSASFSHKNGRLASVISSASPRSPPPVRMSDRRLPQGLPQAWTGEFPFRIAHMSRTALFLV